MSGQVLAVTGELQRSYTNVRKESEIMNMREIRMIRNGWNICEKMILKTKLNQYNFRKMPKIDATIPKKPIKRLQAGPKLASKTKLQKQKSEAIIQRLVSRLLKEDVNLVMENLKPIVETKAKPQVIADQQTPSSLEEDCLEMLGTMNMTNDVTKRCEEGNR